MIAGWLIAGCWINERNLKEKGKNTFYKEKKYLYLWHE